ncbi:redoxin family protein [Demequina aurantiaca]|uniref:redoxin family protein n=1 Tax=Demequina aurantiaca TaxID=676200 RepID=UPI000782FFCD|nr:redoxin domain-containing protein [Demequina aurantiaca]
MTLQVRAFIGATTAGLALLLAGCAGDADPASGGATAPAGEADSASPDADESTSQAASPFDFTAMTVMSGEDFDATSLAGQDVVLWFWAPWCPTCAAEAPIIAEAIDGLPEGVTMMGVAGRSDDPAAMQEFVTDYGVGGIEHLADTDGSIWANFSVVSQPAFIFVNDDGTMQGSGGGLTADDIDYYANELLNN